MGVPASRLSATARASSPGRAGRRLLKRWPMRKARPRARSGGRRPGAKRSHQRSQRATTATTSAAPEGTRYHHAVRRNDATKACGSTLRAGSHASTAEAARPAAAKAKRWKGRARPGANPACASGSATKPDDDERLDRLQPVLPGDLLALGVGASVVGDRHLVDTELAGADLAGDLRLDREVVLRQGQRAQDVDPEGLVPGLHVRERRVEEDVRQQAEGPVPDQVPEEVRALRPTAGEPRPVDDVGDAADDRLDENRDVGRVVLAVRVLDDHDL